MINLTDAPEDVIRKMKDHYSFLKSLSHASTVQCDGRFMKTTEAMRFEISETLKQVEAWQHGVKS